MRVGIIGRIPFIRDIVPFPVITKDGQHRTITARQAYEMEQNWDNTRDTCRIDSHLNEPFKFFRKIRRLFGF